MKIVITAEDKSPDSAVDPRFGRARWFIVADTETGSFEAVDNSDNLNATHGAGPMAAKQAVSTGAEIVITGNCGPNAFRALDAAGIDVITNASGTVRDVVEKFKKGELQKTERPNVAGHWKGIK